MWYGVGSNGPKSLFMGKIERKTKLSRVNLNAIETSGGEELGQTKDNNSKEI